MRARAACVRGGCVRAGRACGPYRGALGGLAAEKKRRSRADGHMCPSARLSMVRSPASSPYETSTNRRGVRVGCAPLPLRARGLRPSRASGDWCRFRAAGLGSGVSPTRKSVAGRVARARVRGLRLAAPGRRLQAARGTQPQVAGCGSRAGSGARRAPSARKWVAGGVLRAGGDPPARARAAGRGRAATRGRRLRLAACWARVAGRMDVFSRDRGKIFNLCGMCQNMTSWHIFSDLRFRRGACARRAARGARRPRKRQEFQLVAP